MSRFCVWFVALAISLPAIAQVEPPTDKVPATVTTTVAPSLWTNLRERVSFGFFSFAVSPVSKANRQYARVEAIDNYIAIDYKLSAGRKISVRPEFTWGTAGTNYRDDYRGTTFQVADGYIAYVDSEFDRLPGDIRFKSTQRVYLPMSEQSQASGLIMRVRPKLEFFKRMTKKWEAQLALEPDYYVQRRTTTRDQSGKVIGNKNYGYKAELGVDYSVTRDFAIGSAMKHQQSWSHTSDANFEPVYEDPTRNALQEAYRREEWIIDHSISTTISKVFLVLGVSQTRNIAKPRTAFRYMAEDETDYYLLTSFRF